MRARRLSLPPNARLGDLTVKQVRQLAQVILEDERQRQFRALAAVQTNLAEWNRDRLRERAQFQDKVVTSVLSDGGPLY